MDDALRRVSDDPGLRAILKTARAWGVSPRRFMGWQPARTFSHVYDNGRLIKTVETGEAEWDDDDRELAIAYAMWEADQCPGCGQPLTETTMAEREGLYVAKSPVRCHWCTASHMAADVYSDVPQAQALLIPIELREVSRAANESDGGGGFTQGQPEPQDAR